MPVFEDVNQHKFIVKGKIETRINSIDEALEILKNGEKNRSYGETIFNR